MFEEIAEILAEQLGISKDKIKLESDIVKDLGAEKYFSASSSANDVSILPAMAITMF